MGFSWQMIFFIHFRIFAASLLGEKRLFVFVLHSSSHFAYFLVEFLCLAIWERSSEPGLIKNKSELLSLSSNVAITDPATKPSLVQFLVVRLSVSFHLGRSSFFKPLNSSSSQGTVLFGLLLCSGNLYPMSWF